MLVAAGAGEMNAGVGEMNVGTGATLVTLLESVTRAGVLISALVGGADAFCRCCFKKREAPNINAANDINAKTNLGLIILLQNIFVINKKSKTGNACLGLNFLMSD
jgi:hypothetical protein